jgi:hypothetical protein
MAWDFMRDVSVVMTPATRSGTTNVTACCKSETAKDRSGGTQKKSSEATLRIAARNEGPYPTRVDTTTMPTRYTMTTPASSRCGRTRHATTVATTTIAVARK